MKMSQYLGATALMLVLGAPAYAQTVIVNSTSNLAAIAQGGTNSAVVFAPGTSVSSVVSQSNVNELNGISGALAVAVGGSYGFGQGAGTYTTGTSPAVPVTGTVLQTATNIIGATSTAPAVANATSGGSQLGSNVINNASLALFGTTHGTLSQAAGGTTQLATNVMSAQVQNGNAVVTGYSNTPSGQSAYGSLNTANIVLGTALTSATPPAIIPAITDIIVSQKLTGPNQITATNSAIANSVASGSVVLDPAVQNLAQSSNAVVTSLAFGAAAGTSAAQVNLTGDQVGPGPGRLTVTVGNTAAAYTGATPGSGNYNLFSNAAGNGIASISGVTQNTGFGLNAVAGGPAVSINLAGSDSLPSGFTQSVNGSNVTLATNAAQPTVALNGVITGGNILPGVVNGMAARTNAGSASVTGAGGSTPTQSFANQQNFIGTGLGLSGSATQSVNSVNSVLGIPFANAVVAEARVGGGSITNVTQTMDQAFNTASADVASLTLSQSGSDVVAGNRNAQFAAGSTTGSIAGAQQVSNLSLNAASANQLSGSLTQAAGIANRVVLTNSNELTAAGNAGASVTGMQVASLGVNVATLGSAVGGTLSQSAGTVTLTNTNTVSALSNFNASVGGVQSSSTSINVIK